MASLLKENAPDSILVTLFGIVTQVSSLPAKTHSSMEVTLLEITTLASLLL
jgi:hypothetical protein